MSFRENMNSKKMNELIDKIFDGKQTITISKEMFKEMFTKIGEGIINEVKDELGK